MATRLFTRQEVEAKNTKEDAAIIIDNVVYDISQFLNDHPGGPDVLLDNAGKDASKCFADVGHSDNAIEWRKQLVLGEVVEAERREVEPRAPASGPPEPVTLQGLLVAAGPPLLLAVLAYILYTYIF